MSAVLPSLPSLPSFQSGPPKNAKPSAAVLQRIGLEKLVTDPREAQRAQAIPECQMEFALDMYSRMEEALKTVLQANAQPDEATGKVVIVGPNDLYDKYAINLCVVADGDPPVYMTSGDFSEIGKRLLLPPGEVPTTFPVAIGTIQALSGRLKRLKAKYNHIAGSSDFTEVLQQFREFSDEIVSRFVRLQQRLRLEIGRAHEMERARKEADEQRERARLEKKAQDEFNRSQISWTQWSVNTVFGAAKTVSEWVPENVKTSIVNAATGKTFELVEEEAHHLARVLQTVVANLLCGVLPHRPNIIGKTCIAGAERPETCTKVGQPPGTTANRHRALESLWDQQCAAGAAAPWHDSIFCDLGGSSKAAELFGRMRVIPPDSSAMQARAEAKLKKCLKATGEKITDQEKEQRKQHILTELWHKDLCYKILSTIRKELLYARDARDECGHPVSSPEEQETADAEKDENFLNKTYLEKVKDFAAKTAKEGARALHQKLVERPVLELERLMKLRQEGKVFRLSDLDAFCSMLDHGTVLKLINHKLKIRGIEIAPS